MKRRREQQKKNMKRYLVTLVAISAISAGGFAFAQGPEGPHGGMRHGEFGIEQFTKTLNLTADQQAKIKPILDAAKPQLKAIHEEAMTKAKAIHENVMSQVRPLLTAEQQAKADQMQKAHQDMHKAMKEMHDAQSE